jgi:hypothetical protein
MSQGYRSRTRQSLQKMELMRKAKERNRLERADPRESIFVPPLVRRRIIVEDYDFGHVRHDITMFRCGRIDSYQVAVDGKIQGKNMGWAAVCSLLRQAFVRVRAEDR